MGRVVGCKWQSEGWFVDVVEGGKDGILVSRGWWFCDK